MSINKQNITRPFKGMHQDTSPLDQPKGSYTVAWNAINETSDGNNNFISNERSNELCGSLPTGYRPIGDVYIGNDETVVFSTDGTNSEIGIISEDCTYTTQVNNTCLNFQITHQIDAIFRVRKGCERTIYFTDGLNPVRYFNLDNPDDFKDNQGAWDCELFRLFLGFTNPCFDRFELLEQGSLESGTYAFALQYLDRDLNPTKWTYITQPVPIFDTPLSIPYNDIIGSSNVDTDELGGSTSATNKAIRLFLSNLDQTYSFYRIAIIESTSFSGIVTRTLVSAEIPIQQNEFTYTGNIEGFTEINVNEVRIQPDIVESAQHIEQLENRLILANIKGKQVDFCNFQQSASQITSKYVIKPAPANSLSSAPGVGEGNSKDPNTYWEARGYMGDEVYAFGIVYVFKDGYESPAYHIPGTSSLYNCENPCVSGTVQRVCLQVNERPTLNPGCQGDPTSYTVDYEIDAVPQPQVQVTIEDENDVRGWYDVICVEGQTISNIVVSVQNDNCTARVSETQGSGWQLVTTQVTTTCPTDKIDPWEDNIAHLYPDEAAYNALPLQDKLDRWRVYNTAVPINSEEGYMAYWEAENSTYPTILDCEGNDYWGNDACGNSLVGNPIRHHKFPDRNLIPHLVSLGETEQYESTLVIEIEYTSDQAALDALLVEQFPGDPNPSEVLTIDYNLDGIAQPSINLRLYRDDFVWNGVSFDKFERTIVTRIGTTAQGIDNIVYSNTFGTDVNTNIVNVSTINGEEVSPTTSLELNILGIKFENVTYPHPDIVGHYIVRGDRDSFNRTIVQKGISNSTHASGAKGIDYNLFSYFAGGPTTHPAGTVFNQSTKYNYLFTPSMLFENDPPNGAYVKQEQQFFHVHSLGLGNSGTPEEFDNLTEFGAGVGKSAVFGDGYATILSTRKMTYAGMRTTIPSVKLRAFKKSVLLNGLTFDDNFIPDRKLYNVSHTNKVQIVELESPGMNSGGSYDIPYVSVKVDRDIHPNLFAIQYYRTHNCVLDNATGSNTVYGGDVFIAPMELSNTLFYQFNDSVWDAVLLIAAVVVAVVVTVLTAGAGAFALGGIASALGAVITSTTLTAIQTGIIVAAIVAGAIGVTATAIDQAIKSYRESGLQEVVTEDAQIQTFSFSTKNFMEYCNEHISGIYVETELNLGLRQDHKIYQAGNFYRGQMDIRAYFRDKIVIFDEDAEAKKDQWVHRGMVIPEVYHYNPDFSKFNKDNIYAPLPESFNCCSECVEEHPTRVQYSEQSFQEESVDNYRIFLANNYRDIEGEKGEITNIFRKHNNLFIHTEEALWQLPQNIQERITGDLISFIGTGEYFSIPPRLILDDRLGSAGSKHKWATIKSDAGVFFIDESNRDIYLMQQGSGMKSISNEGLRNFFKENMIPYLVGQYKSITGKEFLNKNNHANPNGTGYHVTHDTRHERLILTKRDYLILPAYTGNFIEVASVSGVITGIVNDQLFFDTTTRQFGIGTGVDTYNFITLGDVTYFENKSWTISFSLLNNSWTSFHSYLPLYYIYTHNRFYSFIDKDIWRHNREGHFQTFYGTLYPHILEYISLSSPLITRLWDDISMQVEARVWDATTKQYYDVDTFFNKAIFWNSKQCSGLLDIISKIEDENYLSQQVVKNNMNEILLDRKERNWNLNEIRDYRIDYLNSIWSKDWSSIQSEYPIDKVLNTSTIDFAKIWTDLQPLRDKYLVIRLIFDNLDNTNLITNYSLERETQSF